MIVVRPKFHNFAENIYAMIQASDKIAIIAGDHEVSFTEMLRHIHHFAQATPGNRAKTLIISENREGWIYALYAIWARQGIAVPVDAASTVSDIAYIIRDCSPATVWTSREKEPIVRQAIAEADADLHVNIIDDMERCDVSSLEPAVIRYEGQATALICYTSGTTGSPKGVMLSFTNIMANVDAVWKEVKIFNEHTRTIVLLPLHHVLPLVGTALIPFVVGCGVAICPSLGAADIMSTLQRGQISIMVGVPRLWQTLFRGIKGKIDANGVTRALYRLCDKVQSRRLSRLVFSSVRKKMGGHITFCVSGGAALDAETARGLKTLGLDVLEGYGMTETAPIIAFTRPGDIRPGCVGLTMPSVEVKIVDGELLARGRNVMQGYYNRPEETADIIDADGYVHTGDLATIDDSGHITITGRKKEIIVLSNGKNVNPSEIEDKIEHYKEFVKEAAVTQDGDMLRVIIVPQDAWKNGKTDAEIEELLKREVLQPYNATVVPYKKLMSLFVYHGELPRTRLDKLQRFKLHDLIMNPEATSLGSGDDNPGTLSVHDAVSAEPDSETYRILRDYIKAEKHLPVRPTDNLETDLAMDSLDKVTLQGFIEQTFGTSVTADEIAAQANVEKLAAHIDRTKTHVEVEGIDWHTMLTRPAQGLQLPRMAWTGIAFTRICKMMYRLMFRCKAHGLVNIPAQGPVIFAPNHQSFLDAPLVVTHFPSGTLRNTYFYAKKDHVRGPFMRMLARNHNVVIMDMRTLKDSIRALGEILSEGKNLVIFPEGTRTNNGQVGTFKKTFAILARELGVPVVPVRIEGAYDAWPRTRRFPRCRQVSVTYLPPLMPYEGEDYDAFAARIRQAVAGEE